MFNRKPKPMGKTWADLTEAERAEIDPIAAKVMRANPDCWIAGRKTR